MASSSSEVESSFQQKDPFAGIVCSDMTVSPLKRWFGRTCTSEVKTKRKLSESARSAPGTSRMAGKARAAGKTCAALRPGALGVAPEETQGLSLPTRKLT